MPPFGSAPGILQLGGIMEVSLRYGNFSPLSQNCIALISLMEG